MQNNINEIILNLKEYENFIQPYRNVMKEIEVNLEALDIEYKRKYDHNPIHSIQSRIKSLSSIFEKLNRKDLEQSFQSAMENLKDIAGIRVICYYIQDVYTIIDKLKKQSNIVVIKEKDYIKNPKPNGYRSYHLIVGGVVYEDEEKQYYPVEIQIRTLSMDFWASIEHQLCYKASNKRREEVFSELKEYSEILNNMGMRMERFHDGYIN